MRALTLALLLLLLVLAQRWPPGGRALDNHFDACTMARAWHAAHPGPEAWADALRACAAR